MDRVYQGWNEKGTYLRGGCGNASKNPGYTGRIVERQVEREWWWLHGAISAVAQLQAERLVGDVKSFREMQAQARAVDRRRLQIAIRIAELAARRDAG